MDVFKKIKNLQIWRIATIGCKALKPLDTTLLIQIGAEIGSTHTQIGAETVNPSHAVFYPSYFFLSCYGEQRENGELRREGE